ncbi:LUD domain-containing protein [Streptomyces sp. HPF1205]|uniref:LutC/YkgG family protein n=1 Tax=Streptomyces sp. HPF1205 TaxID=2873262 RepID=UPI001CED9637|nr:LUD domain-containing protein [Streptomyces sp. HPF1205]
MNSRDTILGRVRDALADVPPQERPEHVPVPRHYRRSHAGPAGLPTLFTERVAGYGARVTEADASGARRVLGGILADRGLSSLVVPPGFPEELLPEGPWRILREPLTVPALDRADGVLTTAAAAIAVTGTVVLDGGPGMGRRALSLLPDYHLCVVREDRITADVPDALALLDPSRPLTFVSGPSATSDIELARVEGVHGPRTLDILVLQGLRHEDRT